MRLEWKERKDQRHRIKHGVRFEPARLVFENPDHLSIQVMRIISARKATTRERRRYEQDNPTAG